MSETSGSTISPDEGRAFITPASAHESGVVVGQHGTQGDEHGSNPGTTHLGQRGSAGHKGRKRHARSMGRYPFLAYLNQFHESTKPFYAPTTSRDMRIKLSQVHGIFQELKARGLVTTTNPHAFGEREIGAFMTYMMGRDGIRVRPLAPKSQSLYLKYLSVFLSHIGNGIIAQMRSKRQIRIPNDATGPQPSPDEEEIELIMAKLQEAAASGRLPEVSVLGITLFCAYSGVRLKEVRLATKGDFSPTHMELAVFHPKGEGSWATPRKAQIIPPGRLAIRDFLDLRDRELALRGVKDSKDAPLVPYFNRYGRMMPWPDPNLNKAKCMLEERLGIRYDFRMLRRAFGQNALDRGARLDAVSVALGHANSITTERYYARLKTRDAFVELERVWNAPRAVKSIASI